MRCSYRVLGFTVLLAGHIALAGANDNVSVALGETLGSKLPASTLSQQRGGELIVNHVDEQAKLTDNRAINNATGGNFITDSAFHGASGLPVAVQNTGNNVIIQNSFILNLRLR